jgi:hypothetical protein
MVLLLLLRKGEVTGNASASSVDALTCHRLASDALNVRSD